MKLQTLALVIVLVGCSDGADDSPRSFDTEVGPFTALLCEVSSTCAGQDRAACERDVTADMADAKSELDEAGERACAACMTAKIIELQKIVDGADGCDIRAADEAAVLAACDLDPATDYDGDGTPDNDDDEACAGYP